MLSIFLSVCTYFYTEGASDDDLRQLLHTSELNAQKLLAELQAQEQEQMSNKMEMEKVDEFCLCSCLLALFDPKNFFFV